MEIKKIVIFSRHGLRYPLITNEKMFEYVGKNILNWEFEESILTPKGELLEYEFGKFLKKYLDNLNFEIKTKEIYTNSLKRTVLTAKILALSMYPFENIDIKYIYKDLNSYLDERFNLRINKEDVNYSKLMKMDEKLKPLYNKVEKILGLNKNSIAKIGSKIEIDDIGIMLGKGAFKIATDIVDMFILKYYENFKENDIFESDNFKEDLREISKIKDTFLDVIFGDVEYIEKSKENPYKLLKEYINNDVDLSIIVGHDSNISTILAMLNIENKGNDFEKYPIDSKLVFKVYKDNSFDLDMMYYSIDKIRNFNNEYPIIEKLGKNLKLR